MSPDIFAVDRFVEKPDRARAEQMVREGYLWNSGMFVWRVGDFLDEIHRHTPEVAPALDAAVANGGNADLFFTRARSVSVDVGVLERSHRVLVLPGDFGWDDVGTWAALRRVRARMRPATPSTGRHTSATRRTTWYTRTATRWCCTASPTSWWSPATG